MSTLSHKQESFCIEYLVDFNATQAALRAGYKHPNVQGPRMLVNVGIKNRLNELQKKNLDTSEKPSIASPEEILEALTRDHRFNPKDLFDENGEILPISELPNEIALSLAGYEVIRTYHKGEDGEIKPQYRHKYKFPDRTRVRDLLAKLMGLTNGNADIIEQLLNKIIGIQVNVENLQVNNIDYGPIRKMLKDAQSQR